MSILNKELDFSMLRGNDIKEDTIREEVIVPILKGLGYSAFGKNKIIRSKNLEHPYVQFGTKSKKVCMIPDYVLQVEGRNAFILDAKNPREDILTGKNPEQAYSYAIHRDIKVDKYVLCNGVELVVFDVNEIKPILVLPIENLEKEWHKLELILGPKGIKYPHLKNYRKDFGLYLIKSGVPVHEEFSFRKAMIIDVMKVDDETYCIDLLIPLEDEYFGTFDFNKVMFDDFLEQVPSNKKANILQCLTNQPFKYNTFKEEDSFAVAFSYVQGDKIIELETETYVPLIITHFNNK